MLSSPTMELSFSRDLKCGSQGGVGEQASLGSGAAAQEGFLVGMSDLQRLPHV